MFPVLYAKYNPEENDIGSYSKPQNLIGSLNNFFCSETKQMDETQVLQLSNVKLVSDPFVSLNNEICLN